MAAFRLLYLLVRLNKTEIFPTGKGFLTSTWCLSIQLIFLNFISLLFFYSLRTRFSLLRVFGNGFVFFEKLEGNIIRLLIYQK